MLKLIELQKDHFKENSKLKKQLNEANKINEKLEQDLAVSRGLQDKGMIEKLVVLKQSISEKNKLIDTLQEVNRRFTSKYHKEIGSAIQNEK